MSSFSLTSLFLPLKLPQLLLVVWAAPAHLGVGATLGCAESRHAHVWVRMVDGPVLEGRQFSNSIWDKCVTCLKKRKKWTPTSLKSQMMLGGLSSQSRGQFLIFMLVCPSRTSAHSSVTELNRISFWEVYSKYWNAGQTKLCSYLLV